MPQTTEINISNFPDFQSQYFSESIKYLPFSEDNLSEHQFAKQISGLIKIISDGQYNSENIFNLELDSGYPVAVYGFTIALNKEGIPSVMFGNSDKTANEFPINLEIDPDDNSTIFKVGDADIEFEQNSKTKKIECFIGSKKIRVRARGQFAPDLNFNNLISVKNSGQLENCLTTLSSGGGNYGYKLKDLVHKEAIAKGNKFPLKLNVESVDELFTGASFTSRNLVVSSVDGSPIWGVDKNGALGNVGKISIYNSMTAGFICEDLGVARLLLCKLYGGTAQLVIISARGENNPSHNLQLLAPTDEKMALGYKKAKEQLLSLASNSKSYAHLMSLDSVKDFVKAELPKKELSATKAVAESEDGDEDPIDF